MNQQGPIDRFEAENAFLSNFAQLADDGLTLEHLYQSAKTEDPEEYERIMQASTPAEAKRLGRRVAHLRPDWEEQKVDVMLYLLRHKFALRGFREKLLATGDRDLIEGCWWHDNFWGDCYCGRKSCLEPGQNMLGRLLMQVRTELRLARQRGPASLGVVRGDRPL